jgi:succinyl-CoA synthetase alpha subunit
VSVLVGYDTRLVVQGMSGSTGTFHTKQAIEYGTRVVAGVTPGKGGQKVAGLEQVPLYDTVEEAVQLQGANASVIYVPPPFAADAILEAAAAGVDLIICITEGIPARDMVRVKAVLEREHPYVTLVGPNCPGVITPGQCKIGIMPGYIHKAGRRRRGVALGHADLRGRAPALDPGPGPVDRHRHRRRSGQGHGLHRRLALFADDPGTSSIFMIGEIGGDSEERAAQFIKDNVKKPVAAFIGGQTAPPGKRMGHAGAIISGGKGAAADKIAALKDAGIAVSPTPAEMGKTLAALL